MSEIVERLCSSPDAFREPINRLKRDRYTQKQLCKEFIRQLESFAARYPSVLIEPKILGTIEALRYFTSQGQKVLVFSQFNETARYVHRRVCETDLREHCISYDEQAPIELRLKSLRDLRDSRSGVLFCPGEASEGLNLQFASVMVNFDLPWDPMKLEQRIGRIQRIGGKQKIAIVNLVLEGTIEEEILKICQDKIRMFGEVIGQVEEILGNLRDEDDFRTMICNLYLDRGEEDEEGRTISPEEHLEQALDEAIQRSSADQETNVLNMIYFDFSEPENGQ
jgi:SNF2 family DNA or RNA helicase